MVTTQGQENNNKEASSSQGRNSMEQLAKLVHNIIEQGMKRDNQPITLPPTPLLRQDTSDSARERFKKLHPPTFDGEVDSILAEQWIGTTDAMLAYAKAPDGDKVICASFMLRHHVEHGWDTINSILDITTMTWERFRELFYGKYFTDAMKANRRVEFANLK